MEVILSVYEWGALVDGVRCLASVQGKCECDAWWWLAYVVHEELYTCYKVIQDFMVTGLFAGQHNTKLHGTITGVISSIKLRPDKYNIMHWLIFNLAGMYPSMDRFVIPLIVTFVWTWLPWNMTLVQYLVHLCHIRLGKY